jgi:hypothetical protein
MSDDEIMCTLVEATGIPEVFLRILAQAVQFEFVTIGAVNALLKEAARERGFQIDFHDGLRNTVAISDDAKDSS